MASLHKLLSEEGFERRNSRKPEKKVKFRERSGQEEAIALPIYICHDRRSFDSSWQRAERALSLKGSSRRGPGSERSNAKSVAEATPRRDEPAIDDAAVKAVVSILSGYVGRYWRDKGFRRGIRDKCRSCFEGRKKQHSDKEIFAHLEMGIEGIERLVESGDIKKEMDLESLQKSIKIFKIVASLGSKGLTKDSSCGTPDSYLSACAQLYLSIVYKLARNDRVSARHLLQVFSESPRLTRSHLLPELWEHFFLPHLLHLKIWYSKELDFLASSRYEDNEKRIKALKKQYNELMDSGTTQFALYYKEWLKVGAQAPSVPSVPLPSKPSFAHTRRKSSDSSTSYHASNTKSLNQAVFGPVLKGRSTDVGKGNGSLNIWDSVAEDKVCAAEEDVRLYSHVEKKAAAQRMSSSQSYRIQKAEVWPDSKKSDYFRFLGCRTEPVGCLVRESYTSNDAKIKHDDENDQRFWLNEVSRAIDIICSSESLSYCEMAIRALGEAWLDSDGDPVIETALSQGSVIQGIMEVLHVSNDDEILEMAISILAELASKSEMNKRCILSSDPRLDVLIRPLRSSSLFLKAAALLYLVKPKGEQMVSMEWIPLVLRVLEFGDQLQTLFSVRCIPHDAAYYFLDQLLTGFDEDKNVWNARQIISLGGLSLLVRRTDEGDTSEKGKAAAVLHCCIRADGTCRHYLAKNLKKDTILSLLVLGKQSNSYRHALALLTELLCLNRRNQRIEFLTGLKQGWESLNTMHILLLLLQRARPEERSIIAVILLQLDLMGDPPEHSVYREEAIDAIVKALDCQVLDENVQEQSARALLILGGHFSYTGEPQAEKWLLRKARLHENQEHDISTYGHLHLNEENKTWEHWLRKAAAALLTSGNRRLLAALSESIANSIPCLARASLVTVCWMSSGLHSLGNKDLQIAACSVLLPKLIECLNDNAPFEEKILASLALQSLTKGTDQFSRWSRLEKGVVGSLNKLSKVTWAAKELISVMRSSGPQQSPL